MAIWRVVPTPSGVPTSNNTPNNYFLLTVVSTGNVNIPFRLNGNIINVNYVGLPVPIVVGNSTLEIDTEIFRSVADVVTIQLSYVDFTNVSTIPCGESYLTTLIYKNNRISHINYAGYFDTWKIGLDIQQGTANRGLGVSTNYFGLICIGNVLKSVAYATVTKSYTILGQQHTDIISEQVVVRDLAVQPLWSGTFFSNISTGLSIVELSFPGLPNGFTTVNISLNQSTTDIANAIKAGLIAGWIANGVNSGQANDFANGMTITVTKPGGNCTATVTCKPSYFLSGSNTVSVQNGSDIGVEFSSGLSTNNILSINAGSFSHDPDDVNYSIPCGGLLFSSNPLTITSTDSQSYIAGGNSILVYQNLASIPIGDSVPITNSGNPTQQCYNSPSVSFDAGVSSPNTITSMSYVKNGGSSISYTNGTLVPVSSGDTFNVTVNANYGANGTCTHTKTINL